MLHCISMETSVMVRKSRRSPSLRVKHRTFAGRASQEDGDSAVAVIVVPVATVAAARYGCYHTYYPIDAAAGTASIFTPMRCERGVIAAHQQPITRGERRYHEDKREGRKGGEKEPSTAPENALRAGTSAGTSRTHHHRLLMGRHVNGPARLCHHTSRASLLHKRSVGI
mmetsp:Transcript_11499/g.31803  ORF Transcript_11499/g.31803 Transcript_11499/m.31803 type:complete len:169 (+) Transcript_11499:851-1357(+)